MRRHVANIPCVGQQHNREHINVALSTSWFMRLTLCAFITFQENIAYLLTAIRASFGKKLRAQEEPKSLPPDAFPGLQICQNCYCGPAGGAYSAPQTPSWIKGAYF